MNTRESALHRATADSAVQFAALGLCLARGSGDPLSAVEIAKRFHGYPNVEAVLRSAVNAGTTTDATWAGALAPYRLISSSFVQSLRAFGVFDGLVASARRMPLHTLLAIVTVAIVGTRTAQGKPRPVSRASLEAGGLVAQSLAAIVVVSDTVLRLPDGLAVGMLNRELRAGVIAATDAAFLDDMISGAPVVSAGGDPLVDLAALLATVNTTGASSLFFVVSATTANQLATFAVNGQRVFGGMGPTGGTLVNVPTLVTDQLASDSPGQTIVLIDAAQLAVGDEGVILDSARAGSLQLDDAPSDGAASHTSLFQTNSIALRAARHAGWQKLRENAVAVLTAADYSQAESP